MLQGAAAWPVGDPARVWHAWRQLGLPPAQAVAAAVDADLIEFAIWVRFRHPLVRSAVYHSASLSEWQEAHRAMAGVADPDRQAWHRAQGAPGPDEDVAAELAQRQDGHKLVAARPR